MAHFNIIIIFKFNRHRIKSDLDRELANSIIELLATMCVDTDPLPRLINILLAEFPDRPSHNYHTYERSSAAAVLKLKSLSAEQNDCKIAHSIILFLILSLLWVEVRL